MGTTFKHHHGLANKVLRLQKRDCQSDHLLEADKLTMPTSSIDEILMPRLFANAAAAMTGSAASVFAVVSVSLGGKLYLSVGSNLPMNKSNGRKW
jgi:hypothetical protein